MVVGRAWAKKGRDVEAWPHGASSAPSRVSLGTEPAGCGQWETGWDRRWGTWGAGSGGQEFRWLVLMVFDKRRKGWSKSVGAGVGAGDMVGWERGSGSDSQPACQFMPHCPRPQPGSEDLLPPALPPLSGLGGGDSNRWQ